MTQAGGGRISNGVLGALGGLAAFGIVAFVGLLVWILVIEPTHARAEGPASADLSLHVTATPQRAQAGGPITYGYVVRNAGPDDATDVNVSDTLPIGVRFRSGTSSQGRCRGGVSISCDLGSLKKNGTARVRIVVTAPARGSVSNIAQVSSATDDPDSSNDPTTATTEVVAAAASADLKISGSAKPRPARIGKRLTFTYAIDNMGPDPAAGATFTEVLPPDVKIASITTPVRDDCSATTAGFRCPLGDVASGARAEVTVVIIPKAAGTLSTIASVSSSQATDPEPSNNAARVMSTVVGGGGGTPRPKPEKGASFSVYFCGAVTPRPPFHCLHAYEYDPRTGVRLIPASGKWAIWVRLSGASAGDDVEAHYVDTSTRQAAFKSDLWKGLDPGAHELVANFTGPFSPRLRFESVIFYNGRRVDFKPPLLVQFR